MSLAQRDISNSATSIELKLFFSVQNDKMDEKKSEINANTISKFRQLVKRDVKEKLKI